MEPLEKDIDGEPGGGVEVGLSALDIDNVDLRRNQVGLTVLLPLNSGAASSLGWPVGGGGSGAADWPTSSGSVAGRVVQLPRLNLLEDDRGRPKEVRLRNREVGPGVGWSGDDGLEGAIGADRDSSSVKREGAFLLPEAGLWSLGGFRRPKASPTAAIPTVPVAQS